MKKIIFLSLNILLMIATVVNAELIDKSYRERFSNDSLKKNYYRLQMKTASFFDRQTSSVNGLVESFRGTSIYSYDFFSKAFILGSGGVLDAQSFIYDGAIASIAYLVAGQYKKTASILKVYQREFYCSKGENIGLYNAYKTDVPRKRWGLTAGIDGNRTHLGPNVWVAISALQYTAITGKLDFLPFIIDMLKWAEGIKHYQFKDGELGAASMGYGWEPPDWSKVYSTENIVDHYAALKMLKDLYYNSNVDIKPYFKKAKYDISDVEKEIENIERWMIKLIYDKKKKTFNMGYNERGVDRVDALDTVSWTITALTPERLQELGIDPFYLMTFAEKEYYVVDKIGDTDIGGYDFTNQKGRRKNYRMIWFEGTCFHITALQVMSDYAAKLGKKDLAEEYQKKSIHLLNDVEVASDLVGLIDGALPYTSKKPDDKQIYTTFADYWEIPRGKDGSWVASSSSTGWRLIASSAFNPLHFNKDAVSYKLFQKTK
ncbi:MAG: hypothetical protein PHG84_00780 [Endomicrobiaceae bacterium]|nr:hypothetical protein [Endomicrobiaceae bacterium]MDD3052919.1 hypothetical protein [Endomicrobiaceae bacterium]MDD3922891.1 hypothetical protein [Endomicrobiaceae bacterium]